MIGDHNQFNQFDQYTSRCFGSDPGSSTSVQTFQGKGNMTMVTSFKLFLPLWGGWGAGHRPMTDPETGHPMEGGQADTTHTTPPGASFYLKTVAQQMENRSRY